MNKMEAAGTLMEPVVPQGTEGEGRTGDRWHRKEESMQSRCNKKNQSQTGGEKTRTNHRLEVVTEGRKRTRAK